MQPLHPATAKLVKKLAMDTVLCTSHGAYLSRPHYAARRWRGRREYTYELLFRKEELPGMAEEELYAILLEKFRYNDFLWNEDKKFRYRGKGVLRRGDRRAPFSSVPGADGSFRCA